MTAAEVFQRLTAGQNLADIEAYADLEDNILAGHPAVYDDQGEALFVIPLTEAAEWDL